MNKPKRQKRQVREVPCQTVVIGDKKTSSVTKNGCTTMVAPSKRLGIEKFDSAKDLKATFNLDKPCHAKRKGCPVQLAFDGGQPFLRFCGRGSKQLGYRVDVESPAQAMKVAGERCMTWEKNGRFDFPSNQQIGRPSLGGSRKRR